MRTIVKNSLISVVACGLLFGLQGCGEDRAGITKAEAAALGGLSTTSLRAGSCGAGTDDVDCDWLPDAQEGPGKLYPLAVPGNPDSDGDNLADGCEYGVAAAVSDMAICSTLTNNHTNPQNKDTDGDGIDDDDEIKNNVGSAYITDPTDPDSDDDGIEDGVETGNKAGSNYRTNPNEKDTDGDMLSDGVEQENQVQTNPLVFDTDGDGVSDGIEVCGTKGNDNTHTNGYGSGKVTAIDVSGINVGITDGNTFYTDKLSTLINHYGGNTDCSNPVTTVTGAVIDVKNPSNDSDGDGRPNNKEQTKGNDPLDFGNKYLWITETVSGQAMIAKGFEYIPQSDTNDGFWMSKIEARSLVANTSVEFTSLNNGNVNNVDRTEANTLVTHADSQPNANYPTKLPTQLQYQHLFKIYVGTFHADNGFSNCLKVDNRYKDGNVAPSYTTRVCELKNDHEVTDGGTWYNKDGSNSYSGNSPATDTSFRAATGYIAD